MQTLMQVVVGKLLLAPCSLNHLVLEHFSDLLTSSCILSLTSAVDSITVQPSHFLTRLSLRGRGQIISSWQGESCCHETAGLARPCLLFARLILAFSARS